HRALQPIGATLESGPSVSAPRLERALVVLEAARPEQGEQQRLPRLLLRLQELREAVLREEDHLQELIARQSDDLAKQFAYLFASSGEPHPVSVSPTGKLRGSLLPRHARPVL